MEGKKDLKEIKEWELHLKCKTNKQTNSTPIYLYICAFKNYRIKFQKLSCHIIQMGNYVHICVCIKFSYSQLMVPEVGIVTLLWDVASGMLLMAQWLVDTIPTCIGEALIRLRRLLITTKRRHENRKEIEESTREVWFGNGRQI